MSCINLSNKEKAMITYNAIQKRKQKKSRKAEIDVTGVMVATRCRIKNRIGW